MKERIFFRSAVLGDIDALIKLESEIWGDEGADEKKIISRIETFPRGNVVAELDGNIVAYEVFGYIDKNKIAGDFSWAEITDSGTIRNMHNDSGEYAYGVNLTVGRRGQFMGLGNAITYHSISRIIEDGKRGTFIGSRIPGYRAYLSRKPATSADEYSRLRWKGKSRDSELKLYESLGFNFVRVLPNYFPDPPSLNFGALVLFLHDYRSSEERLEMVSRMIAKSRNF